VAAPHLSIVVPVYNGARRLPASLAELRDFLCAQPYSSELIIVDDHSAPETATLLRSFANVTPNVRLLRNERNSGKGFAVARGVLAARGRHRVFTDADLAYPAAQVARIVARLESGADVAVACRVLPESRYVMSPSFFSYLYTRHVMSRMFNLIVRWTLVPGILDTQAGLKGFTAEAAESIFPRLATAGFGFDVEVLRVARRRGLIVAQTPVEFRYDEEPTTVRFVRDAVLMIRDLVRIRWKDWRGDYD
jgi:glycosyltransferase involved in cell wall biosynthesis